MILIDDIELFASEPAGMGGVLRHFLGAGIQFVLAGSPKRSDLELLQVGHNFNSFELGPLSASEIASLTRNWFESRNSDDLKNLSALAAWLLTGFNFREVLQILQTTGGVVATEQDIRKAIGEHFEQILSNELSSIVDSSNSEKSASIALLLDKAESGRGGIRESEWRKLAENDKTGALRGALERLVTIGVLTRTHDNRYTFAHRLIEDWWRNRRELK